MLSERKLFTEEFHLKPEKLLAKTQAGRETEMSTLYYNL